MKIVFISNYLSVHQLPFCLRLSELTGNQLTFVATTPIGEERLQLGYENLDDRYPFVIKAYFDPNGAVDEAAVKTVNERIEDADIVLLGGAPECFENAAKRTGKIIFRLSERLYKEKVGWWRMPVRIVRHYQRFNRYKKQYLLCSGAFVARDYALTFSFLNRAYRWGYFPEFIACENMDALLENKRPNALLWVARFLDWKHPEMALEVARRLKEEGYDFSLTMIGNGELFEVTKDQIVKQGLQDVVTLTGGISPPEVRRYMEESEIFLFTSDRQEGWGAVLNESMNSACAVVADDRIGAVPYLLKNGENGLVYHRGNVDELYEKVKFLLNHAPDRKRMAAEAYRTIAEAWNSNEAAERFYALAQALQNGQKTPFSEGLCSLAKP